MGWVFALPCDKQTSEHADWTAVTDLSQLSIYAQLLQYTSTMPCMLSPGVPHKAGVGRAGGRATNVGAHSRILYGSEMHTRHSAGFRDEHITHASRTQPLHPCDCKQSIIKADSSAYIVSHAHILLICLSCLAFPDWLKLSARWSSHNSPKL